MAKRSMFVGMRFCTAERIYVPDDQEVETWPHLLSLHRPCSRHLPVAVTEGSLIRNLNKTAVRLWTDRSRPSTAETD